MDGLRRDDPAANDRLDLDRIREALGPQDPGGDTAGEERALPELPRSSPTDPVLGAFPDTGAPAPVMEEPLQGLPEPASTPARRSGASPEAARPPRGPSRPTPGLRQPPVPGRGRSNGHGAGPGAVLGLGLLAGLLVFAGLFLHSLFTYGGAEYMGVSSDDLSGEIMGMFRDTIILTQLTILGLTLALGALAGISCGLLVLVATRLVGRRPGHAAAFGLSLALVLPGHLLVLAHGMVLQPQLFVDAFYARGGLPAALQAFFSDHWPVWLAPGIGLVALLFVVLGGSWLLLRGLRGPSRALAALPVLAVAGLLGAMLTGSRTPALPEGRDGPPNVILLAVDSLRPDLLEDAPEGGFMRLLEEGAWFRNAWTSMPRTLPAWVSMLTGLQPFRHGIRHMFPTSARYATVPITAVDRFAEAGYQTAIFSDFAGDIFRRLDIGFQVVSAPSFALDDNVRLAGWKPHVHLLAYLRSFGLQGRVPNVRAWERMPAAAEVTGDALRWLAARDPERPFFLTLFYSTTHFPFASPYPFHRRGNMVPDSPDRYMKADLDRVIARPGEREDTERLFLAARDTVDLEVRRLLDALEEAGLLDRTIVVLVADHGENCFEHDNGVTHGDHLYGQHSLRIPLVVRLPDGAAARPETTARGIDVAPTLLALAGLPPLPDIDGMALFDAAVGAGTGEPRPVSREPAAVYAETGIVFTRPESERLASSYIRFADSLGIFDVEARTWAIFLQPRFERDLLLSKHRMWLRWPHKLLYIPTRQGPRWELYDLEADPGETVNLFREDDARAQSLRDEMAGVLEAAGDVRRDGPWLLPR